MISFSNTKNAILSRTCVALFICLMAAPAAAQNAADDDTAAERLLLETDRHLERGDIEAAMRELNVLVERLPNSRLAPLAMLRKARILIDAGRFKEARAATEEMIQTYPGSPESAGASVLASKIVADEATDLDAIVGARTELRRIPNLFGPSVFPRLIYRSEARVVAGDISSQIGELSEAAADYLAAIEDEPSTVWTARAQIGLARVFFANGQPAAAAEELQRVLLSGEDTTNPDDREEARRLLTLFHRLVLRAQEGQQAWQKTDLFTPAGVTLKKPNGIAVDEIGRMILTDEQGGVYQLDAERRRELASSTKSPRRPLFDNQGNAWFLTPTSIEAVRGPRLAALVTTGRSKPMNKINGAQPGKFGEWIVVDGDNKGVSVFDDDRSVMGTFGASTLSKPSDVARDSNGKVYILDAGSKSITSLTLTRRPDRKINIQAKNPEALAVDKLGNFYILDGGARTVNIVDPAGRPIETLGPTLPGGVELKKPTDVAVDGYGRVYIADARLGALAIVD